MKVYEILEGSLLKRGNHIDRDDKNKDKSKDDNVTTGKRIVAAAKERAAASNPDETETPVGWRADPHQGGHVSAFINR